MEIAKSCLVVDARKVERLSLDGPALKVRVKAQSPRLFPLRRLSRIHVLGELDAGLDALIHCAEHQIPVAFFTVKGKLRCQLYFPVLENTIIAHWLEYVEFDQAAKDEYSEWRMHQCLHLLAQMGCRNNPREDRLQLMEESLNHICKKSLGEKEYRLACEWLNGMLTVHMSQVIVNHGLANQSRGKRCLMDDLLPLFELWLKFRMAEHLKRRKLAINASTMSHFYQDQSAWIDYTLRRMLTQLATRLEAII